MASISRTHVHTASLATMPVMNRSARRGQASCLLGSAGCSPETVTSPTPNSANSHHKESPRGQQENATKVSFRPLGCVYTSALESVTMPFLILCCPFLYKKKGSQLVYLSSIINGEKAKVALTKSGRHFLLMPQTPKSNGRGSSNFVPGGIPGSSSPLLS